MLRGRHPVSALRKKISIDINTLHAHQFHGFQPVARPQPLQHAMNMVLDGLLGKIQLRGDLFIGHPCAIKGKSCCSRRVNPRSMRIRTVGVLPVSRAKLPEQREAQSRRANRFALARRAHGGDDVHGRGVLQDVAHHTRRARLPGRCVPAPPSRSKLPSGPEGGIRDRVRTPDRSGSTVRLRAAARPAKQKRS